MGNKTHPYITRDASLFCDSCDFKWYASRDEYAIFLKQSVMVDRFLKKFFSDKSFCIYYKIHLPSLSHIKIDIFSDKSSAILGDSSCLRLLSNRVRSMIAKDNYSDEKKVSINVYPICNVSSDPHCILHDISNDIKQSKNIKRSMRDYVRNACKNADVKGIHIYISGKHRGEPIARIESIKHGRMPLHTLDADIRCANEGVVTSSGVMGVKVFVFFQEICNDMGF